MPGFFIPDPRAEWGWPAPGVKPPGPAVLSDHAINREMQFYYLFDSLVTRNLVQKPFPLGGGDRLTLTGSVDVIGGNFNVSGVQSTNYFSTDTINNPEGNLAAFNFTLSFIVKVGSRASDGPILEYAQDLAGFFTGIYMRQDTSDNFDYYVDNGYQYLGVTAHTDEFVHVVIVGDKNFGFYFYEDGVLVGSYAKTVSWARMYSTGMEFNFNNGVSNTVDMDNVFKYASFQFAALSAVEVWELFKDPFKFVIPA